MVNFLLYNHVEIKVLKSAPLCTVSPLFLYADMLLALPAVKLPALVLIPSPNKLDCPTAQCWTDYNSSDRLFNRNMFMYKNTTTTTKTRKKKKNWQPFKQNVCLLCVFSLRKLAVEATEILLVTLEAMKPHVFKKTAKERRGGI